MEDRKTLEQLNESVEALNKTLKDNGLSLKRVIEDVDVRHELKRQQRTLKASALRAAQRRF